MLILLIIFFLSSRGKVGMISTLIEKVIEEKFEEKPRKNRFYWPLTTINCEAILLQEFFSTSSPAPSNDAIKADIHPAIS